MSQVMSLPDARDEVSETGVYQSGMNAVAGCGAALRQREIMEEEELMKLRMKISEHEARMLERDEKMRRLELASLSGFDSQQSGANTASDNADPTVVPTLSLGGIKKTDTPSRQIARTQPYQPSQSPPAASPPRTQPRPSDAKILTTAGLSTTQSPPAYHPTCIPSPAHHSNTNTNTSSDSGSPTHPEYPKYSRSPAYDSRNPMSPPAAQSPAKSTDRSSSRDRDVCSPPSDQRYKDNQGGCVYDEDPYFRGHVPASQRKARGAAEEYESTERADGYQPPFGFGLMAVGIGAGLCIGAAGGWLVAHLLFGTTKIVTASAMHNVPVSGVSGAAGAVAGSNAVGAASSQVPLSVAAAGAANNASVSATSAAASAALSAAKAAPVGTNLLEATTAAATTSGSNAAATAATAALTSASTASLSTPYVVPAVTATYSIPAAAAATGTAVGASSGCVVGAGTAMYISQKDSTRRAQAITA